MDAFELWAFRRLSWTMRITNHARGRLLRRVQLKKACLVADIRKKKNCYFGNIIRHNDITLRLICIIRRVHY